MISIQVILRQPLILMRPAIVATVIICELLAPMATANADTFVYKYTGRDGVTVYTQTLPDNYRPGDIQTITIETLPIEQQRAAIRMLAVLEANVDAKIKARQAQLDFADQDIATAIKNLQQAESDLKSGSAPIASDLIGKVGGGTRLRESYFLRVSRLQKAVEHAKLALDKAYGKRNSLR